MLKEEVQFMDQSTTFFTKKNIIVLIAIAGLLIAIPLGIYLVQRQQQLRSRANLGTGNEIQFVQGNGVSCTGNNCVTSNPTVEVMVTSPFGPPPGVTAAPAASTQTGSSAQTGANATANPSASTGTTSR